MRTTQRLPLRRGLGAVIALASAAALVILLWANSATAAPGHQPGAVGSRAQNVDYLSASDAQTLDAGINVLVPASVPAPFGGAPQIQASSGYYSLYWMIPGTPATFLQVSGTAGGALPAGSPADLNNELSVNASVRGADAIHDVTSIYDTVWWIEGGVLYEVSSLNMTGTDTMGLADSLISLQVPDGGSGDGGTSGADTPPSADQGGTGGDTAGGAANGGGQASVSVAGTVPSGYQATVVIGGVNNATLTASDGVFTDTGSATYGGLGSQSVEWQSPNTAQDESVTFTLSDPNSGATLATSQIVVTGTGQAAASGTQSQAASQSATQAPTSAPAQAQPADQSASTGTGQGGNGAAPATDTTPSSAQPAATQAAPAPTSVSTLRESGMNALSDGTEGPPAPVYAGDGTGGSYTVTLPVRQRADQ